MISNWIQWTQRDLRDLSGDYLDLARQLFDLDPTFAARLLRYPIPGFGYVLHGLTRAMSATALNAIGVPFGLAPGLDFKALVNRLESPDWQPPAATGWWTCEDEGFGGSIDAAAKRNLRATADRIQGDYWLLLRNTAQIDPLLCSTVFRLPPGSQPLLRWLRGTTMKSIRDRLVCEDVALAFQATPGARIALRILSIGQAVDAPSLGCLVAAGAGSWAPAP